MTLQTQTGEAAAALQCQLEGAEASHSLHAKLAPVPDLDNRRFCRACETTLPVEAFPPGTRRYLCKRHLWLRVKKPSKERALADPRRRLRWVLWRRCYADAQTAFGHGRVALRQADIAGLLPEGGDGGGGGGGGDGGGGDKPLAIVPADPIQLLSNENVVVVGMDVRRRLLRAYRAGGANMYLAELGKLGRFG